jgi:hypothetical protein
MSRTGESVESRAIVTHATEPPCPSRCSQAVLGVGIAEEVPDGAHKAYGPKGTPG